MAEGIMEVEDETFEAEVLNADKPVMVDFWAPWCGPCKAIGPVVEELAQAFGDKMIFAKCNVDDSPAVASRYGIKSIPTLMIFQGGNAIDSITGMVSQSVIENAIDRALAGEASPAPFIVN